MHKIHKPYRPGGGIKDISGSRLQNNIPTPTYRGWSYNAGWVKGLLQTWDGNWGGYIWAMQNTVNFKTSATNTWVSTEGVTNSISRVLVGTIGDYGPMENKTDTGPTLEGLTNNPPSGGSSDNMIYTADFTAYYELANLPLVYIEPLLTNVCINSGNVTFTLGGASRVTNGVTWSLTPEGLTNGATLTGYASNAVVNVGGVATTYVVRATANENTNIYGEAVLNVLKVNIVETNVYAVLNNTITLHLTPDSSTNVEWEIIPSLQNGAFIQGSSVGTSIVFNAGSIPTNYTVKAYAVDLTNCFDACTVTVISVELITPAGDPTNAPVDSGDGQNEFTFSTNNPGVLEINLKAEVIPTGVASQIASRCQFLVDAVGNSTLAWDSANSNGTPTASNDFLLAKVTFTGLPANNVAFGSKKAAVYFGILKQDEKPYEVFFAKWAYNNPIGGTNNPNWFYYWKEGDVCGIGPNCVFVKRAKTWGYTRPWDDSIIRLCDWAPEANDGPRTYYSYRANEGYGAPPNGAITVAGQGKGIYCVAETIQHESEHIYIYGIFHGQADYDWDGIPNAQETTNSVTSYGGIASDPATNTTYDLIYDTYSDQELRCLKKEMIQTINVYPNLDWANPGCQSKNAFGL